LVDSPNGIQVGEGGGKEKMARQRKGTSGMLEMLESAPMSEFATEPMNEFALPPVASPGSDQEKQMPAASTAATASVSLPVVSSPGSPGTEEAPSTPVITGVKEVKAPVQETREADANMLLMLKKTPESPTEDAEDAELAATGTVPV